MNIIAITITTVYKLIKTRTLLTITLMVIM